MNAARLLPAFVFFLLAACGGGGSSSTTTGSGTTPASGVDLIVTNISAPASANADSSVDVTVTVANQGSADAYGAGVSLSLNYYGSAGDDSMGGLGIYYSLPAGGSATQTISMTVPRDTATGRYYLVAKVLYDSAEANADNNSATTQIDITGTSCTSDAAEQDNSPAQAAILQIGVPVTRNHCEGSGDWFRFDAIADAEFGVRVDESSDAWVSLAVYNTDGATLLASSGSIADSSSLFDTRPKWKAPTTGTYYVRVAPLGGLMSSGANTDYTVTLGDLRPDLIAGQSFTAWNTSNTPGGILYVTDTVQNKGFAAAGTFTVATYLSTDATITTTDTLLGTRTVTSLALGDYNYSSSIAYSIPSSVAEGSYFVGAIVNHNGAVNELITTNNVTNAIAITISATSCAPDSFEGTTGDDTSATASTIVVGAAEQSHNFCDDTVDWLRFSATNGSSYAIRTAPYGVTVQLYDPNGSPITHGSSWTAPLDGTYYLAVTGSRNSTYTIKVDPVLPDLTASLYVYNNVTTVIAGGIVSAGDRATNIGHADAGPFKLGVYLGATSTPSGSDILVTTRDVSSLATNAYGSGTYYGNTEVQFPRTLAADTYYIYTYADYNGQLPELSETNNTATPIAITVTVPSGCTLDTYDDDDFPSQAKAITAGAAQTHNFCDDDRDWVSFTPTVNGTYLVLANGWYVSGVSLYASDGTTALTPHATDFDQLSFVATAGQTYYVKTYGSMNSTSSTDYQLSVTRCTLDAYEEDDTLAAAKAITVGTTQSHNHCDDEDDWVSFDAVSGTTYTFTGTNVGASAKVSLTLYDANGNYVASSAAKGQKQVLTWTATGTGKYYVRAYSGSLSWGLDHEYTLGLN